MRTANLILCILNVLCLAFNIYTQNYFVAAINGLAIVLTASAIVMNS
jgi:hypothetical protein